MVEFRQVRLESLKDPRVSALTRLGGGELVESFLGTFEGQPAFIVDDYVALEFGEAETATIVAHVFEKEETRALFLEELAERSPLMAGRRPPYWPPGPRENTTPEPEPKPHLRRWLIIAGFVAGVLILAVALIMAQ